MITDADIKKMKSVFVTKDDFAPIKKDISSLKKDVSSIKKDTSSIHKEIRKLRKAEEISAKYFDTVTTGHRIRLKNIEKHLDLPTPLN